MVKFLRNLLLNEDNEFLAYTMPWQLINSDNKMMIFLNGKLTENFEINKNLYNRLFGGDSVISLSYDPTDEASEYDWYIDPNGDTYYNCI